MTILITLHRGCIGSIFITGIFGNFYTERGGIFDFQNGNSRWSCYKHVDTGHTCTVGIKPTSYGAMNDSRQYR